VQDIFGVHLIHDHLKIPHDTIMLGSMFRRELSSYWTKSTPFEAILANPVHGHIFTVSSNNRLLAYEYREGLVPKNVTSIDHTFFWEFFKYLRSNKLAKLLALEVLEDTSSLQSQMREFVLAGQGTVLVKEDKGVAHTDIYRVTGWSFAQDKDDTVSVKEHGTHASTDSGEHQVFTDGKPLRNIDAVMNLLLQEGVIKSNC